MKYVGISILVFFGIIVLWGIGIAAGIFSLPFQVVSNKVQLNQDIINDTVNAKNCETWQDWFKTEEGDITTLQQTVQNAQTQLDQFNQDYPDKTKLSDAQQQQYSTLQDNLTGAKNEANDAINTYDAKAKQENLAYCKNGLPLFIHPF